MLVRRRLSLGDQAVGYARIVRHEQFADSQTAVDLLSRAQQQAEALLLEAQGQRQHLLDQALSEFWEQAGAFLRTLETEYQAVHGDVLEASRLLLNQVIDRLFDECSVAERARVLIRHLAASQTYATGATLSCHPEVFAEVQAWVAASRFAELWQLREDPAMSVMALRLSSETGEFDLDWMGLRRCLLA